MLDKELSQKKKAMKSARKQLGEAFEDAKRQGLKGDEFQFEVSWAFFEHDMAYEELQETKTRRIVAEARSLEVPVPRQSEKEGWKLGQVYRTWYLTDKGYADLRSAIRKERRERHESKARWVVLWTGIIGAVTGLLAVIGTVFG